MTRTFGLSAFVIVLLLGWQGYGVWSMTRSCAAQAHAIIAAADPLDRAPPRPVAAVIEKNIALDRMFDFLATMLLDRYKCGGGSNWSGTEWMIDQPALSWRLRTAFSKSDIIALFASTADTGKGRIGINRSARRIYKRDVTALSDQDLNCLVWRSVGKPLHQPVGYPVPPFWLCPEELSLPRVH
jgi:Transglycosylase